MYFINLTLDLINKEMSRVKTEDNINPTKLLVGRNQYKQLSAILNAAGLNFTEVAKSDKEFLFGLEVIKVNFEDNYFEMQ